MKLCFCLFGLISVLVILYGFPAQASSYYLWDEWGGTYFDAEKSAANDEDDNMCWAATASNILAWTGWGDLVGDADVIFAYYQDHWTDEGGNVYYAWDWWFDGTNDSQGLDGWAQVDVDGGNFWESVYSFDEYVFSSVRSGMDQLAMSNIEELLTGGYGTALGVTNGVGAHAITCWGYETDENGNFLGIYVTDSDDDKTLTDPEDELAYYEVELLGSQWYLLDFYGFDTWYITEVQGLSVMPASVPMPSTLMLLGSGLLGFSLIGRKRAANA